MSSTLPVQESQHLQNLTVLRPEDRTKEFLKKFSITSVLDVRAVVDAHGPGLEVNGRKISLSYPTKVWGAYPEPQKKILSQNLAFCYTFFLPYIIPTLKTMKYHMPVPLADPFVFKGFSYAIPSIALNDEKIEQKKTTNLLRKLFEIDFVFDNKKTEIPPLRRSSNPANVVIPFSFGKDSLLTLALSQELGLTVYPVYISEPGYNYEYNCKQKLTKDFFEEYDIKVEFLENTLGAFRESDGYIGWELQLTHYSLMLLPYVFTYDAAYVIFANEQSCNDTVIDKEGFRYNPVFEQSHSWLMQNSLMASLIGGNSLSIGSIIEPLHDLAIIKILHTRYPKLARYQMSCDPEDKDEPNIGNRRWCENCSKCARIYIYLLANNIDPKRVGFEHDLLDEQYGQLYTLFGVNEEKAYGYDASEAGKEEQMFAFYLAHKNGSRGKLMDRFEELYFKIIKKREAKLRVKYFGIHSTLTVPQPFRNKLLSLYHEELDDLKW